MGCNSRQEANPDAAPDANDAHGGTLTATLDLDPEAVAEDIKSSLRPYERSKSLLLSLSPSLLVLLSFC